MCTVYNSEYDSPHETRIGMVSAPSQMVAHRVAELQFIDSKIHKIMELTPPEEEVRFPGARFINGEFRPIPQHDEKSQNEITDLPVQAGEPEVNGETTTRPVPGW